VLDVQILFRGFPKRDQNILATWTTQTDGLAVQDKRADRIGIAKIFEDFFGDFDTKSILDFNDEIATR